MDGTCGYGYRNQRSRCGEWSFWGCAVSNTLYSLLERFAIWLERRRDQRGS
jgi:hypothetical protein